MNLRILQLDMSKTYRKTIEDLVMKENHNYVGTDNSEDAFKVLESQPVQLIITGLELSHESGLSFLNHLAESQFRHIPVIVVTSIDSKEVRETLFNLGIVDYLIKGEMTQQQLLRYIETMTEVDHLTHELKNKRIAAVDDSVVSLNIIRNVFTIEHVHHVDFFTTPKELLETDLDYDIFLVDLIIPGMSGRELIHILRERCPKSVIIAVSGINNYKTISNVLLSGADDYLIKPFDTTIFLARLKANVRTHLLLNEIDQQRKELHRRAITDGLTGLYNHQYICDQLDKMILDSEVGVLIMDIDNFKMINDTYGHSKGDDVLREIAKLMQDVIGDMGYVGRYGGEEFLVITKQSSYDELYQISERIRIGVKGLTKKIKPVKNLTISGGIVYGKLSNGREMIRIADRRLYIAKGNGKNQIVGEEQ